MAGWEIYPMGYVVWGVALVAVLWAIAVGTHRIAAAIEQANAHRQSSMEGALEALGEMNAELVRERRERDTTTRGH